MVTRVNGAPRQGFWFGADIKVLTVVATGGTFLADLTVAGEADAVNTGLEQVLEAIATRATVIAVSVDPDNTDTVNVMVDYANAFTAGQDQGDAESVEEELATAINAIAVPNLSGATVATFGGFAGAALGVAV